jgi:hypothetical protein
MKENLLKNIKMFLKSASAVYDLSDYTSATILYFKAFFVATDYISLETIGKSAKDHTERFRILEQNFPDLYKFLDSTFQIYQKTYSYTIDKKTCDMVRENVERIIKKYKIPI